MNSKFVEFHTDLICAINVSGMAIHLLVLLLITGRIPIIFIGFTL